MTRFRPIRGNVEFHLRTSGGARRGLKNGQEKFLSLLGRDLRHRL